MMSTATDLNPTDRPLGMTTVVAGEIDAVQARVVAALKEQGFGILSEIDVQATLQTKIGAAIEPYRILGACNPHLAHRALEADRSIGLLLPCNVVLRQAEPGSIEVSFVDPEMMFASAPASARAKVPDLPAEARERLSNALEALRNG
ncbi:MAG: DUF302 domain-containing protein [Trueperaceae bacterium]